VRGKQKQKTITNGWGNKYGFIRNNIIILRSNIGRRSGGMAGEECNTNHSCVVWLCILMHQNMVNGMINWEGRDMGEGMIIDLLLDR
jgi:hypothetical protein